MPWNKYNESDKENALLEILNEDFAISAVSNKYSYPKYFSFFDLLLIAEFCNLNIYYFFSFQQYHP